VFTLAHELAHLSRGGNAICDAAAETSRGDHEEERLCDAFAAAFLLPGDQFSPLAKIALAGKGLLSRDDLVPLAAEFRVSPEVALRRCLTLGLVDEPRFRASLREWPRLNPKARQEGPAEEFRTTGAQIALGAKGRKFIDLVLDAYGAGLIEVADAANFIGVKLADLDRLQGHPRRA
jgi:Zn-dependent peptidase ImmA (M78 family)